jgi:uncharacterized protein YjdB
MGKVKYYIDGAEKGTYSLYNASNINETKIASFTGLDEGEHVFKAVATGERDTNSTNALIDCAKVVVTHQPYVVTGVTLDTTSMTLGVGDSKRISYTVAPDYATIDDMTYTSGDTSVATVGADGTVTGSHRHHRGLDCGRHQQDRRRHRRQDGTEPDRRHRGP